MGGVSSRTLTWLQVAAALVAAGCAARTLVLWKRRHPSPARGLLPACLLQIVEHAQSAAILLLAMCALPLPIIPLAYEAFALAPRQNGLFYFLPLAAAMTALALAIAATAAACVCWLALRRLRAEPADFAGLGRAMAYHARSLWRWARQFFLRPEEVPFNPFVLPALLCAETDLPTAAKNAAAFAAAPEAVQAVLPLYSWLTLSLVVLLAGLLPLSIGFFSLPLVTSMGYSLDLSWGIDGYMLLWAALAALLCGALLLVTLLACAALVHASTVYLYGTGGETARARALRRLKLEWVWPAQVPAAPPPPVAKAPAAPPPVAAPASAVLPPPAPAVPALAEYAQERVLPAAGRADREIGANLPRLPAPTDEAEAPAAPRRPSLKEWLRRGAHAALRAGVVLCAGAFSFYIFGAYDGPYVIRRLQTLRRGQACAVVVDSIAPAPKGGLLQYRVDFSYDGPAGRAHGAALAGEPALVYVARGHALAAHRLSAGPRAWVALDEDYGFTGQRLALLLALISFLLIGAWSFAFRVL